jgi:hypothetical protein
MTILYGAQKFDLYDALLRLEHTTHSLAICNTYCFSQRNDLANIAICTIVSSSLLYTWEFCLLTTCWIPSDLSDFLGSSLSCTCAHISVLLLLFPCAPTPFVCYSKVIRSFFHVTPCKCFFLSLCVCFILPFGLSVGVFWFRLMWHQFSVASSPSCSVASSVLLSIVLLRMSYVCGYF